jgi:hypothetical protein
MEEEIKIAKRVKNDQVKLVTTLEKARNRRILLQHRHLPMVSEVAANSAPDTGAKKKWRSALLVSISVRS